MGAGAFTVQLSINAPNGVDRVEYYIDDEKKYFTSTPPYVGTLFLSKFYPIGSNHLVVAKVIDSLGYSNQSAIQIKVASEGDDEASPFTKPEDSTTPTTPDNEEPDSTPDTTVTTDASSSDNTTTSATE